MTEFGDNEVLPWHDDLWQLTRRSRRAGRVPHAWLLCGPPGLGKGRFARRLVQALLCQTPDPQDEACGRCRSCTLLRAGSHPDYLPVQPAEDSKTIKVDQVRALSGFLAGTSQLRGRKLVLLEPADCMNVNAANSLLKTLEEPSSGSHLLLVTAGPSQLPATVRSRCQILAFRRPDPAVALDWLAGCMEGDPQKALALAGGAPLEALAWADPQRLERRRVCLDLLAQVADGRLGPVPAAEDWLKQDRDEGLQLLVQWHQAMIRLKLSGRAPAGADDKERTVLRELGRRCDIQELFRRLDAVCRLHESRHATLNLPMALEALLADWSR